jgi:hypothetical protein
MTWADVSAAMSDGIADSSVTDRITYYGRSGPRTIKATLERSNSEDLDVNIPGAIVSARACDIDAEPHGQRISYDSIEYTIREAREDGDDWLVLILTRADQ